MDAKNEARALPSKEIEKLFKCVKQGTLAILPSTATCTSQSFFITCKRKQSVGEAEKLLSPAVAKWLRANNFLSEARFVEVVSNWHKASDGRGLSEADRKKNNLEMLDYLWKIGCHGTRMRETIQH